jgi:hypothetical protein
MWRQALVASTGKNQAVKTSLRKEATRVIRATFFDHHARHLSATFSAAIRAFEIRMGAWRRHEVTELLRAASGESTSRRLAISKTEVTVATHGWCLAEIVYVVNA